MVDLESESLTIMSSFSESWALWAVFSEVWAMLGILTSCLGYLAFQVVFVFVLGEPAAQKR